MSDLKAEQLDSYVGDRQLYEVIDNVLVQLKDQKYGVETKQALYDSLVNFSSKHRGVIHLNDEILSYMFRGWWISRGVDDFNRFGRIQEETQRCPCCLREHLRDGTS